ncbi:hypothetical protein BZM26_09755 [Paraburkholderia strydomiana]|nr:hypothetical protein BZM26_09755 [Paraburkholderia strydomiana]
MSSSPLQATVLGISAMLRTMCLASLGAGRSTRVATSEWGRRFGREKASTAPSRMYVDRRCEKVMQNGFGIPALGLVRRPTI